MDIVLERNCLSSRAGCTATLRCPLWPELTHLVADFSSAQSLGIIRVRPVSGAKWIISFFLGGATKNM